MNERIKQLAKEAGFNHMGIGLIIGIEEYHQKFAELIVRECADICEKDGRWWADQGYLMEAGEAGSLATQIKEHFGVK